MLKYAQERLSAFNNVRFVQLSGAQLAGVADGSIHVVYCTNMLPHLDEMERWQYVREAYRVLRDGGRLYLDSIALESPAGWAMLTNNLEQRRFGTEPPYMPLPSTGEELAAYCRQAGFDAVRVENHDSLLIVTGTKTGVAPESWLLRAGESIRPEVVQPNAI
jgi:SAM-dependent methyltransferase